MPDTVCQRAVWKTTSARHCLPDAVCQTAISQMPSTRLSGRRGVCQTPSTRHCLPDAVLQTVCQRAVWQAVLCQTVWQTPRLLDAVYLIPSCRHCLPDAVSARCHVYQTVWQTAPGRQCLADGVCQAALCQTVWQTPLLVDGVWQTVSSRQCLADSLAEGRLADTVCLILSCRRCLPDAVWRLADHIWQTSSARHWIC